jgi:hypothetical protein
MYWSSFLILSLALYLPPLNLAYHLWAWARRQEWWLLLLGWRSPAWPAYVSWLALAYLGLGTALHVLHRRQPGDGRLARAAMRLSRAGLGGLEVLAAAVALVVLLLAWPVLPAARVIYGWDHAISLPVATLAGLYLLAEALRLVENNLWDDQAIEARRTSWLIEHGYFR